jgi:hypothetical protein
MDSSGCVFSFTSTPSFQFLNCTSKSGDSSEWRTCLGRCCPSVQDQRPSMAALELCKLNSPYLAPTLVIVMMIVFLSTLGVLVVLCFFFVLFKVIRAQTSSNRVLPQLTITQVEWSNENSFNSDIKELQWSDAAKRERVLPEVGPCAICLEDNTTAELYCGHQYHPACIGSWLRKRSCCPCCRLANLRGAKIHCK